MNAVVVGLRWSALMATVVVATACASGAAPLPDLTAVDLVEGIDGGKWEIKFKVKNVGTAATSVPFQVYVDAIDPTPPAGSSDIRQQQAFRVSSPFQPAQEEAVYTFWIPADLQNLGVSRFVIRVDAKDEVRESNESNNEFQRPYPP